MGENILDFLGTDLAFIERCANFAGAKIAPIIGDLVSGRSRINFWNLWQYVPVLLEA